MDIFDDLAFYEAEAKTLHLCESFMENFVFIEDALNDLLNAISFARLNVLHNPLRKKSIHKNHLPLQIFSSNIAQYVEFEAYQFNNKITFVLRVYLVEHATYILYHLYQTPILDDRQGLHHVPTSTKIYVVRNDDSLLYASFRTLDNCKPVSRSQKVCTDVLPYPTELTLILKSNSSNSCTQSQRPIRFHYCTVKTTTSRKSTPTLANHDFWACPCSVKCE